MVLNHLADGMCRILAYGSCDVTAGVDHKQGPAGHEHQQGDGGLVHFRHTLDSYTKIADDEDDNNQ